MALFMHGILGTKRNWHTPALLWKKLHPQYSCTVIDHRGHGGSNHHKSINKSNTIESCAKDLIYLFNKENISYPDIVIAHSFSGKVAIQYLQELKKLNIDNTITSNNTHTTVQPIYPKHVWILDSIPHKYKRGLHMSPSSVFTIFDILTHLPRTFESKEYIVNELTKHNIEASVIQWLCTNIIRLPALPTAPTSVSHNTTSISTPKLTTASTMTTSTTTTNTTPTSTTTTAVPTSTSTYTWSFNLDITKEMFYNFCETDMWHCLEEASGPTHIHYIRYVSIVRVSCDLCMTYTFSTYTTYCILCLILLILIKRIYTYLPNSMCTAGPERIRHGPRKWSPTSST